MVELSAGRIAIALVLGLSCAVGACGGDDAGTAGTGGTTATGGGGTADSSMGGRGGTGGSTGTGGATGGSTGTGGATGGSTGTGGATGGSTGTGGVVSDASNDRSDASGGTNMNDGGPRSDASDATVASDAAPGTDASPGNDATDAVVLSDVSDAATGDGFDGNVCGFAADGALHATFYSFDFVDGGATGVADWTLWIDNNALPVGSSVDDFALESSTTPGSLHATINYSGYGTFPVLERDYFSSPIDLSCYTRVHFWVKFTSPLTYVKQFQTYAGNQANEVEYANFYDHVFGPFLDVIGDGNWHEFITPLPTARTAMIKFGVQLFSLDVQPDAGAPAVPPPVDVFIDNVWFE
jgi:hypothetical protein